MNTNLQTSEEITSILIHSQTGNEAFRKIFYFNKAKDSRFSTGYLTKYTSIRSKGYISEVLSSKKLLNLNFVDDLIRFFKLSKLQGDIFRLLWQCDHHRDSEEYEYFEKELIKTKKLLKIKETIVPEEISTNLLLNLEIYSYIGMHQNGIELQEIKKFFSSCDFDLVKDIVQALIKNNFVFYDGNLLKNSKESFLFFNSANGQDHLDFLKQCISQSIQHVGHWFHKFDYSHFESMIITVNKDDYVKKLPEVRRKLLEIAESLDSQNADMLIRLNTQIYPSH